MAWKRNVLRRLPVFARMVHRIEVLEEGNRQLDKSNRLLLDAHRQLMSSVGCMFYNDTSPPETAVDASVADDALPIPPASLRYLVGGTDELPPFMQSGQLCARALGDILARQGLALNRFHRVLDFGCGCGRVLRHLKDTAGVELHGTDCNLVAILWCQRHFNFAQFGVNSLRPPLRYVDRHFDFIFAFSIFTHLTEELQAEWMQEWRRVLVPGGYLLVTVHGDSHLGILAEAERAEYRKGNMVIREQDVAGTNFCAAFHPPAYVRRVMARGFEVIDFLPEGPHGNPPQDVYLLKSIP